MKNKVVKTVLGILIAAIFLFLALRGQPLKEIFDIVVDANPLYIIVAAFFYFLSYITRSEKWRIQVENLDYKLVPKTAFYALMLHFFVNSFTIKLGGIIRCGNLKKTANIPFPTCFGSYMSECVFDFLFMFIGLFLILALEFNNIIKILTNLVVDLGVMNFFDNPIIIIGGAVFMLSLLVFFIYLYKKGKIFKNYQEKIQEFIDSLKKTFNIKKFWLFIFWNIVLWIMLYFMNYFLFIALFNSGASVLIIFTITAFSYAAWLMPNPGGIGSVEYFVLQAFLLFGLTKTSALAFGILSNGFTLFFTLFFGIALIIIQSLFKVFVQEPKNQIETDQKEADFKN